MTSGVARIWEGTTIDVPKAWASTRQRRRVFVGYGEGCPLPSRLGVWGASWAPPSGSRAEPRPLSHFLHVLGHRTLLVPRKIRWPRISKYLGNRDFYHPAVLSTVTSEGACNLASGCKRSKICTFIRLGWKIKLWKSRIYAKIDRRLAAMGAGLLDVTETKLNCWECWPTESLWRWNRSFKWALQLWETRVMWVHVRVLYIPVVYTAWAEKVTPFSTTAI